MTFEEFVHENSHALLRFALALTADAGLAEDLVQDALMKTYRAWPRIGRLDNPWTYVRRILVNEHVSWRRKWSRVKPTAAIDLLDRVEDDVADAVVNRDQVLASLRRLPPAQRAAVVLRYLEGVSMAQIADTLGCREATARGYVSKGLTGMRLTTPAAAQGGRSR